MQMPASTRSRNSPTLRYTCLAALFAATLLYQARTVVDLLHSEKVDVPDIEPALASASLETVSPEAERAGLHRGDVLLAINGGPYVGSATLADAVAKALIARGVSPDDVRPIGRGKNYPVATNDTPAGRQQNRRVEIVFSDDSGRFAQSDSDEPIRR